MFKMFKILAVLLILITASLVNSAKILAVFPTPSISHQVVFRPLTQELARKGHEVVVITTDPAFSPNEAPPNLTEIDMHSSYNDLKGVVRGDTADSHQVMQSIIAMLLKVVEKQLKSDKVQELIKDKTKTFDLLLAEACLRHTLVFSHIYKVPVIQISSLGAMPYNYKALGVPTHPLLYPTLTNQRIYNLTTWEKIVELYNHFRFNKLLVTRENEIDETLSGIFGDIPSLSELENNIDMLFVNLHPIWEGNYPVPPNVVHLGGLHQTSKKELSKDMKTYMDSSKHGVIYMSFGTNMNPSMLPPEKIQMFIKVFSKLPYDILWKWDLDELPNKPKNVRIGKWFPQSDLLRHPKLKLFITQGGLQSTDEAISAGVPVIGIPMLGDQYYNTEKYVYHNIGKQLVIDTLDEKTFYETITTVIDDESYRKNVVRLRTLMQDQPMSSLDRAVWWTEYVIRHGGARHLRSPAANISWAQYLELELVAVLLIALCISATLVFLIVRFLLKQVLSFNSKSKRD